MHTKDKTQLSVIAVVHWKILSDHSSEVEESFKEYTKAAFGNTVRFSIRKYRYGSKYRFTVMFPSKIKSIKKTELKLFYIVQDVIELVIKRNCLKNKHFEIY